MQRTIRWNREFYQSISIQVEDIYSTFGCNPQSPEVIFANLMDKVILQAYRFRLCTIIQELITIISAYTIMCGNPDVPSGIFKDITYKAIRQPCIFSDKLKVVLTEKAIRTFREKRQNMYQTDEKKENTLFHFFSIRIRASTAITYFSVASSGLISISLISVAKRNKVERRTIISANLSSFTPFCPRVPLIIL